MPTGPDDAAVTPSATLPKLDKEAMAALERVGEGWNGCLPPRKDWEEALPVDRHIEFADPVVSRTGRFAEVRGAPAPVGQGDIEEIEATSKAGEPSSPTGRTLRSAARVLIGPPLRSTALAEEKMGRLLALSVLSPDALSSVAYGPEAMLAVLLLAGSGQLHLSLPIGAALAILMLSVGLGYRQVITAYPQGGGSYIIASDSLGARWGLIAGAGLILDYILTVAVSVASGVEAVTSAIPSMYSDRVLIGLLVIFVLAVGNLRGVRDAGAVFAAPTYLFVAAIALIVVTGLVKAASHGFTPTTPHPYHAPVEALGVLLVLRAFSSGATAMTGIEVISNAVPVFRPPEAKHARQTLTAMLALLISMFVGVVLVAHFTGAQPGGQETLLSKIARDTVGSGAAYAFVQFATTVVLLVAANSAFNGFPRLLYFMARDSYVPRLFLRLGDRLAFSNGILVLAVPSAIIFAAFGGKTAPLIPLFAIGVFIAFTLAQGGMVARWLRGRERGWRVGLATNLLGAALSAAVVVIAALTKFTEGAWLVVLLVPLIVLYCERVHGHYETARQALTPKAAERSHRLRPASVEGPASPLPATPRHAELQDTPIEVHNFTIVPVATFDLAALRALAYAASLGQPLLALHVSPTKDEAKRFRQEWEAWGNHLPLEIIVSPFRATVAPLTYYAAALHRQRPDLTMTLVVPEIVVAKPWQQVLHSHTAGRLRRALRPYEGIVVATVPFHLPP